MYTSVAPLVLASASPRRKELLEACGLKFTIDAADINEQQRPGEAPVDLVRRLATEKAKSTSARQKGAFILGADTDVVIDNEVLGKPASFEEARAMLQRLSGRTHTVLGACALVGPSGDLRTVALSETAVTFRALSADELTAYATTKEPYDKAGGYAAQGIGASFVERIDGSYTNVVGLDVSVCLSLLKKHEVIKCN